MNTTQEMPSEAQVAIRRQVADTYAELADRLLSAGLRDAAHIGFQAAAELDLQDSVLQASWGGPFNGQENRRRIILDLLARTRPSCVIETGTYRATSTVFLAEHFNGPIHTCEISPRFFLQSRKKLQPFPQVRIEESDSRSFLRRTLADAAGTGPAFIYLDAHWQDDLPLKEEVEIILASGIPAVIMVDDFAVPFDSGYAYDDYGPGKTLNIGLLLFLLDSPVRLFFPSLPAAEETGARRGCCVLTTSAGLAESLAACPMLRSGDWRDWEISTLQAQLRALGDVRERAAAQEAMLAEAQLRLQALEAAQATRPEPSVPPPPPGLRNDIARVLRAVLRRLDNATRR